MTSKNVFISVDGVSAGDKSCVLSLYISHYQLTYLQSFVYVYYKSSPTCYYFRQYKESVMEKEECLKRGG